MSKRFTTAYTIFSLIVFIFLIVWFVFRAINTRTANILDAEEKLSYIAKTVSSSYLAGGSFSSAHFGDQVSKKIMEAPEIEALAISSNEQEIVYLFATNRSYIPQYDGGSADFPAPVEYAFNALAEEHIATTVIVPAFGNVRLDAVYSVFGRAEVFPIIRELLIGLLSFLLITAILIIIYPALAKRSGAIEQFVPSEEPRASTSPRETPIRRSPAAPVNPPQESNNSSGLYSPDSSLGWERYLEERLSAELKRAASFDQDLVLLLATVQGLKKTDSDFARLSEAAREFFTFEDLCFEYGRAGLGIIIPNVDIDQGIERAELFKNRANALLSGSDHTRNSTIFIGLSARNGRLISGVRIIREAKSALRRSESEPGGIIAFRVDPQKYREYIASRKTRP